MRGPEAELARVGEQLRATEEALRSRDRALALVAHDLKNPLNVIELNCQRLEAGAADDDPEAATRRIRTAARRMRALIRELLDIASLEAQRGAELQRASIDLVALTREVVDDFRALWVDRTIELEPSMPTLVGAFDRNRMERVVANLLSNALKFSLAGSTVKVTVVSAARWAVIEITDAGIGIPTSAHPYLFRAFRRGPNVIGRIHGDGIGLASAHDAVTRHGGSLTFRSTEGEGSTFTVRVPIDAAAP